MASYNNNSNSYYVHREASYECPVNKFCSSGVACQWEGPLSAMKSHLATCHSRRVSFNDANDSCVPAIHLGAFDKGPEECSWHIFVVGDVLVYVERDVFYRDETPEEKNKLDAEWDDREWTRAYMDEDYIPTDAGHRPRFTYRFFKAYYNCAFFMYIGSHCTGPIQMSAFFPEGRNGDHCVNITAYPPTKIGPRRDDQPVLLNGLSTSGTYFHVCNIIN